MRSNYFAQSSYYNRYNGVVSCHSPRKAFLRALGLDREDGKVYLEAVVDSHSSGAN
jgi:hypothetical protein